MMRKHLGAVHSTLPVLARVSASEPSTCLVVHLDVHIHAEAKTSSTGVSNTWTVFFWSLVVAEVAFVADYVDCEETRGCRPGRGAAYLDLKILDRRDRLDTADQMFHT